MLQGKRVVHITPDDAFFHAAYCKIRLHHELNVVGRGGHLIELCSFRYSSSKNESTKIHMKCESLQELFCRF
jgi:hypothetical protein